MFSLLNNPAQHWENLVINTKFINALRHYHRKYKEKDRLYSAKPNHDWSSHFNDALRTLATGLENEKFNNIRIRQTAYDKGYTL